MGVFDKVLNYAVGWALDRLTDGVQSGSAGGTVAIVSDSNFKEAAAEIRQAVAGVTAAVIGKIESDQLELLCSRIRNMGDLIKLADQSEVRRYIFTLREVVDYAENRVSEGKKEWQGPFLMGKVAIFGALQFCSAESSEDRNALESLCRKAKYGLLDIAVTEMVQTGKKIPWDQIERFLSAKSDADLTLIGPDNSTCASSGDISSATYVGLDDMYVSEITVKVSARVRRGDVVAILEGGKATEDVVAEHDGVVHSILVMQGDLVTTGMIIAHIKRC
ncbi:lipoyl domain-containing protein [Pseudomonas sp. LS-2]|uniref:lipoyl domain-containing protein n=1 Tax=Pseudomonas sp. LS-2 TaxID=2315859 RepID=UPI000E74AFAE|nr:lipoyl domain-containing protein [Pseudomonas sp. LS-2]RJX81248.1 hypothetical protein D3M70_08860 [Pseudomonas sp. LS-2]